MGFYENPKQPNPHLIGVILELDLKQEFYSMLKLKNDEDLVRTSARTLPARLRTLRRYKHFRSALGVTEGVILMIPKIALLSIDRRSLGKEAEDTDLHTRYITLQRELTNWRCPSCRPKLNIKDDLMCRAAAKILQSAVHVFLETAYWHSHVPASQLAEKIEPYVTAGVLWLDDISHTQLVKHALWPLTVLGASIRKEREEQRAAMSAFWEKECDVPMMEKGREMVEWVWNHASPDVLGLPGLEAFAAEKGINLPI